MEDLVPALAAIPGVVAVVLGGSRARGEERPDSDWDFGLYYRDRLDVDAVRALGLEGDVFEPGDWGRLMNGGAWLERGGIRVDVIYRELGFVEQVLAEVEEGRFQVDNVFGFVAGMPSYVLVAELALGTVLHGELPRPEFPASLRATAPKRWRDEVELSLRLAEAAARRSDIGSCAGLLARAATAEAQARLAERGEWAWNEKRLLDRAGLGAAAVVLAFVGSDSTDLGRAVRRMRTALGAG